MGAPVRAPQTAGGTGAKGGEQASRPLPTLFPKAGAPRAVDGDFSSTAMFRFTDGSGNFLQSLSYFSFPFQIITPKRLELNDAVLSRFTIPVHF